MYLRKVELLLCSSCAPIYESTVFKMCSTDLCLAFAWPGARAQSPMVFASMFSRDRRLLAGGTGSSSGTTGNEVGLVLTRSFVHGHVSSLRQAVYCRSLTTINLSSPGRPSSAVWLLSFISVGNNVTDLPASPASCRCWTR